MRTHRRQFDEKLLRCQLIPYTHCSDVSPYPAIHIADLGPSRLVPTSIEQAGLPPRGTHSHLNT